MLNIYDDLYRNIAKAERIQDPWVLKAIAVAESGQDWMAYRPEPKFFKRYIQGKAGWAGHRYYDQPQIIAASWGLMQVMYTTACELGWEREFCPWDLLKPAANIRTGARLLAQKLDRYGNLSSAVSAYNAGVARIDGGRYQNQAYVDKVMRLAETVRIEWEAPSE